MTTNDGGPAFIPVSLRDYFAAAALQGLLAQQAGRKYGDALTVGELMSQVFAVADAMLRERERKSS
jgi:hypothetical protein